MLIFLFCLGIICGFGGKLAADYYRKQQNQQEKTYLDMEKILTEWKAIELLRNTDASGAEKPRASATKLL